MYERFRRAHRTKPGDIVIETWNCTKGRPWLVLWVDDDAGEVCVVAITNQKDYCGAISTGHPDYQTVGAWVMIQPLHRANKARRAGYIDQKQRETVARKLQRNLAIVED